MTDSSDTLGERVGVRRGPQALAQDDTHSVFLDAWLAAHGDPLKALIADLMPCLEPSSDNRVRSLRSDARGNLMTCLENVTANLVSFAMAPSRDPETVLAVPTAKTRLTRYHRGDFPHRLLRGVLMRLEEEGFLTRHPYVYKQRTTTVEPTPKFLSLIEHHGVRPRHLGRTAGGESIWLSAREDGVRVFGDGPIPKTLVDYRDTNETHHLRGEILRLNEFLDASGFEFDGERTGPIALRRSFLLRSQSDPHSFDLNGRLGGGWWMNLKADQRHRITISSEPIADLDWSNMFARLVYLKATGAFPTGDLYDVPGLSRKAAKRSMLSLLSRTGDMQRLHPKLKALLPEGFKARQLVDVMAKRHPAIAGYFGTDIGVELMAVESRLLMDAMLDLERRGVPCMGLHDGLQVPASAVGTAASVMEETTRLRLGVVLPVVEKPVWRPSVLAA